MHLFNVFGIKLQVSPYFLALMALYAGLGVWPQAMALFALVLVHEWVHILAAKGFGVEIEAVELLPFGGVARFKGLFETDPMVEVTVALAGPASNLVLAVLGVVLGRTGWLGQDIIDYFIKSNLAVAGFNLLPALPLDGGRVLRAWLNTRNGYRKATRQAALAGKVAGISTAVLGIICLALKYTDFTPVLTGIFVFLAARKEDKEAQFVFLRYLTRRKEELVTRGMLRTYSLAVKPDYPVKDVVRQVLPQRFTIIHVIDEQFRICATFTETQVIRAMFEQGIDYPVGQVNRLP